ncbi:MAG: hypothetical protein ACTS3F_10345 [Phycisphaerales bacterium]
MMSMAMDGVMGGEMGGAMSARVRLGVSLSGLRGFEEGDGIRSALEWAGRTGFEFVGIDAADARTRPRLLDRSARRDLASAMRRAELSLGCVELWIPAEHVDDAARADRAVAALLGGVELAGELAALAGGRACFVTALRSGGGRSDADGDEDGLSAGARAALELVEARAGALGVEVGEAGWPMLAGEAGSPVGVAVDPASIIAGGGDPVGGLSGAHGAGRLRAVRLNDLGRRGRVAVAGRGEGGRLDAEAFVMTAAALNVTHPLMLDLSGIAEERQRDSAAEVVRRFGRRVR